MPNIDGVKIIVVVIFIGLLAILFGIVADKLGTAAGDTKALYEEYSLATDYENQGNGADVPNVTAAQVTRTFLVDPFFGETTWGTFKGIMIGGFMAFAGAWILFMITKRILS